MSGADLPPRAEVSTGDADRADGAGGQVLRVSWVPGADRLCGRCFCGAESEADNPLQMLEWLFAHPDHRRMKPTRRRSP